VSAKGLPVNRTFAFASGFEAAGVARITCYPGHPGELLQVIRRLLAQKLHIERNSPSRPRHPRSIQMSYFVGNLYKSLFTDSPKLLPAGSKSVIPANRHDREVIQEAESPVQPEGGELDRA
jgi:hypothetical protein